jgi:hypothetical protein
LIGSHDVQVDIGLDAKKRQDLIPHVAMLCRGDHTHIDPALLLQGQNDRGHFDRFGTRSNHAKNFFTDTSSLFPYSKSG